MKNPARTFIFSCFADRPS